MSRLPTAYFKSGAYMAILDCITTLGPTARAFRCIELHGHSFLADSPRGSAADYQKRVPTEEDRSRLFECRATMIYAMMTARYMMGGMG